jgi:hypothetical protein
MIVILSQAHFNINYSDEVLKQQCQKFNQLLTVRFILKTFRIRHLELSIL